MAGLARSDKASVGVALASRADQPHACHQATVPIAYQWLWGEQITMNPQRLAGPWLGLPESAGGKMGSPANSPPVGGL